MVLSIPILDRLTFRDYQGLVLTLLFFGFETVIRLIVTCLPTVVINFIDGLIKNLFPWLSQHKEDPKTSSLEKAESFEKMMLTWHNYICEQHLVRTQDDYLLCVHRIPSAKVALPPQHKDTPNQSYLHRLAQDKGICVMDHMREFKPNPAKTPAYTGKPVVLLSHGFLMSSEIWICNRSEYSNLPLILAQQGYDVWLSNARGNKYSQTHLRLNPKHQDFWEFSINEFAMIDLPDVVDHILQITGAPDLTYIGFSQGTAQAFAGLSVNPQLNKKINLFIALAPATTPKGLHHPLIDAFVKATPSVIYLLFGRKTPLKLALFWQRIISPPLFVKLIDRSVQFLFGWTGKNMSTEQKLVSYQHLYSLTSVKSLVHWFQIIRVGRFQMYDELPSRLPYHTVNAVMDHVPPQFPTKQITTPIAIFYGRSDSLVDFDVLANDLPHPLAYVKSIQDWEHLDFLWAEGIDSLVYPDIFHLLSYFNPLSRYNEYHREGPTTTSLSRFVVR